MATELTPPNLNKPLTPVENPKTNLTSVERKKERIKKIVPRLTE